MRGLARALPTLASACAIIAFCSSIWLSMRATAACCATTFAWASSTFWRNSVGSMTARTVPAGTCSFSATGRSFR